MAIQNISSEVQDTSLRDTLLLLKAWGRYLKKKWILLSIFALLGIILGFAYHYLSPKIYTARTNLILDEATAGRNPNMLSNIGSIVGLGGTNGDDLFSGNNLIWLYSSDKMVGDLLLSTVDSNGKEVSLINMFIHLDPKMEKAYNSSREKHKDFKGFPNQAIQQTEMNKYQVPLLTLAINRINKDYLVVSEVSKTTGIINVSLTINNEYFAYYFVTNLVNKVNDFYITFTTQKEKEQVDVLQEKVDEFNKAMNKSLYQAAKSVDEIPFANPLRQTEKVNTQRSNVDVQTNSEAYITMMAQLEKAKIALAQETPLIQVIDSPILPLGVSRPKLVLFVPLFLIGFLILGLIIVILPETISMIINQKDFPGLPAPTPNKEEKSIG